MKFRLLVLLTLPVLSFNTFAQTSPQLNAAEIKQGLEELAVTGSLLYIAAHPDDENTRLLAWMAREKKVRTGYLALTRGDGGQNLIGTEQADLLGLIRTQELLAARRTDGAEQFFTRANDFGFSKNAEESFKTWDKQKILGDVVWVIRKFRPDVIVTRFPEDARAGHGHHSASAILAREAFFAAADPKKFPEQLSKVKVWQAKRILWNTFNFGGNNTTSESQLKLDVGAYNQLLGKGYGEISADSRSNHKSQGFGSAKQRGQAIEYFSPTAGTAAQKDLFEGIDLSWTRVKGSTEISKLIQQLNQDYQIAQPSKSLPLLAKILTALEQLKGEEGEYWKIQKIKQVKTLIIAASGLWFESYGQQPEYAVGDDMHINSQVLIRAGNSIRLEAITGISAIPQTLVSTDNQVQNFESTMPAVELSQAYWLAEKHPIGSYTVNDPLLIGYPENPGPPTVTYTFNIEGKSISFDRPVVYKYTDPVKGEIYQPLVIAPPVTATLSEKAYVFNGQSPKVLKVQLRGFAAAASGYLQPKIPQGWKVSPEKLDISLAKGAMQSVEFVVTPAGKTEKGVFGIDVVLNHKTYHEGYKIVRYDHIPLQTLFPLAEANVAQIDLKFSGGKRIAYLAGAGDLVPEALKEIGYDVTMLNESQVINSDPATLSSFDAIITGVRFYNINEQAKVLQPKLMQYVANGGTFLVQYNVNTPLKINDIGPYPFRLSRDRVTEEDAEVSFLAPEHPALNYPNKITAKDFEGWVQERGIYFATDLDPKYTPILSMHDTNEKAGDGSLIIAGYGKGKFVYTSLVFFRELPAGVPGAYRLFVNLISNPKK
ncbi:PIG-L family deacetylase [Pedobacter sp. MC2016-14]|uniref:PIG-L family deacetylase n=1 Tax=Pedobacter sp. MC2016-14 TaxID=2897327 RepID=UPI001E2D2E70|nr:PIG-L family deacetylase [Pedobacter sp. MC2016-14]MCD0489235.1 PIG-L family deacetylase [Pedobacter sp. MC2016-14]